MTLRWLTFFSLLTATATGAEVSGQVSLRDSRDSAVRKNSDFSGVIVSFDLLDSPTPEPPAGRATMLQKNKTFTPHVLPVQVGTVVEFPNADPIFHNAFSSYSGQVFDIGLYRPGSSRSVRFLRPGVVRVFCNIHPTMSAIIVVLTTPRFVTSRADGRFALNLPPGRYELHVFHERATGQTLKALTRVVQVGPEGLLLPPIIVSEAGYLPAPHTNKYGRAYPPESDDQTVYPGVRK